MRDALTYPMFALPRLLAFALLFATFASGANNPAANSAQDNLSQDSLFQENLFQKNQSKVLAFDVFLENKPIGSHEFILSGKDGEPIESAAALDVGIEADFKVKVLFVTAFAYQHNNRETWKNGCLQSIEAKTLVNGAIYDVSGATSGSGFALLDQPESRQSCARSFAYWDRSLLTEGKLLNSQTGEFTDTTLRPLGDSTMQIGSATLPVTRYALEGKDVQVTLTYTRPNGAAREEWVGLESTVKGGRTLRYVRTPDSLQPYAGQGRS